MIYIFEKIKKKRGVLLLGVFLVLFIVGFYFYNQKNNIEPIEPTELIKTDIADNTDIEVKNNKIFIDIKGAVKNPGVYELDEESRVIDAIKKSGGLNKNADTSIINLSKKLEDGNVIIIYTKEKIEDLHKKEVIIEYIEKECDCPDNNNSACLEKDEVIYEDDVEEVNKSKISLNTANKEQLMTLTGIGESKANDIIEYRNTNGNFKTIEEIKNIKGIGDSLFEAIKDFITI